MKPVIDAAIGVLADSLGQVLVAQRPPGKICPGKWEFPGGKIEDGETSFDALRREMKEELGVDVLDGRPLVRHVNEFPDRLVNLDVWLINRWTGVAYGVENQPILWVSPEQVLTMDFLPGGDAILPPLMAALGDHAKG